MCGVFIGRALHFSSATRRTFIPPFTKLGDNAEYARFAQYFLAQSAKTVADKHYIVPSQVEFDKAVAWLGKQYGF